MKTIRIEHAEIEVGHDTAGNPHYVVVGYQGEGRLRGERYVLKTHDTREEAEETFRYYFHGIGADEPTFPPLDSLVEFEFGTIAVSEPYKIVEIVEVSVRNTISGHAVIGYEGVQDPDGFWRITNPPVGHTIAVLERYEDAVVRYEHFKKRLKASSPTRRFFTRGVRRPLYEQLLP